MAVIEGGVSASLTEVGLGAAVPMHVTAKPIPYGANGHYRVARRLVPAGTTLAGNLWTFRNPTASGLVMVIERVKLQAVMVAAPTAAIEDRFTLKVARAYTVADTTGSASIAPAAAMQKARTSMGNAAAQLREANIAAGASGGTRTLDTDGVASGSTWVSAALGSGLGNGPVDIFDHQVYMSNGVHPLTLVADEGLLLTNDNNFGAVSGIILQLTIAWAEVTLF